MFLVVFVTLVVSIIGLYAQVLSLQTAKINQSLRGLMETMLTWHGGANDLAKSIPAATYTANGMTGCRLTYSVIVTGAPPVCPLLMSGANVPPGYNVTDFSFYSVAFQTTTVPPTNFIITYVHDTDGLGDLELPDASGAAIGNTLTDLRQQFFRSAPLTAIYGTVTASGVLTPVVKTNTSTADVIPTSYAIPTSIPVNSLAVISSAQ